MKPVILSVGFIIGLLIGYGIILSGQAALAAAYLLIGYIIAGG